MKRVMQTQLGGVGHGNCLQAAIASILELPIDVVPHAVLEPDDVWWTKLQVWARENLTMDLVAFHPGDDWVPAGYHLITGKSHGRGIEHATVGFKGEIVHDPHPSSTGLQPDGRLFWMFIPLDPSDVIGKRMTPTIPALF